MAIVDYTDFCRRCGGTGTTPEETERGTTLHETCDLCRGTGCRTIATRKSLGSADRAKEVKTNEIRY